MRLTLVSSRTRVDPSAAGDYAMDPSAEDPRFQVQTGAVQSIVINDGRDDGGMFTMDHRDERYLPFEGGGVISGWSLALTSAVPTFDWRTITDVVLHIRYTAREGGDVLRQAALKSLGNELAALPLRRAFSARSEFSTEWNAFLRPAEGSTQAVFAVELAERLFPYFAHDAGLKITNLELVAVVRQPGDWRSTDITVKTSGNLQTVALIGSPALYAAQPAAAVPYAGGMPPGTWEISMPVGQLGAPADWAEDLILIVTYQVELDLE